MDLSTHHHSAASESQHQVNFEVVEDVVVGEDPPLLQLLPREYEPLLVGGDAFRLEELSLQLQHTVLASGVDGQQLAGQGPHTQPNGSPRLVPVNEANGVALPYADAVKCS